MSNQQYLTQRLILRQWKADDRAGLAQINACSKVNRYLPSPLTRSDSDAMLDGMQQHFKEHGFGFWALELNQSGVLIGFCGLARPNFFASFLPAIEVGWRVSSQYWNQGLATEAAQQCLTIYKAIDTKDPLISYTVHANQASQRVMQKVGLIRDVRGDFRHSNLPRGHRLSRHCLYRL